MPEPESLILQLLREMCADMAIMGETMATKSDIADVRLEVQSLRADTATS